MTESAEGYRHRWKLVPMVYLPKYGQPGGAVSGCHIFKVAESSKCLVLSATLLLDRVCNIIPDDTAAAEAKLESW